MQDKSEQELVALLRAGVRFWCAHGKLHYRAPSGTLTSRHIAFLRDHKDTILQLLEQHPSGIDAPFSSVRSNDGPAPLSTRQEDYWRRGQNGYLPVPWYVHRALRFRGELRLEAIQKSLALLHQRHEALRTRILETSGQPVQIIDGTGELALEIIDLTQEADASREHTAAECIRVWLSRPIRPEIDSPFRCCVVCLSPRDHVVAMAVDHLLADARSLTILSEELIAACHAFASGVAPVLPPVRVQMADYALWQRKHEKEILARHLPYWLDCLANAQPLALPSDWPRSCLQTFSEGRYDFELCDARVTSALRSLTGPSHSTISMLILAGCVALLARWTKQTSIVLRHTVSSRNHPDLGNTVGFLFDHVLLHIDVADDPDFLSIVRRVKDAALGAQEHALVPLNVLMHALGRTDATALCETFAFNFIPREMASQETAIAARAAPPLTDLTISPFPITTKSQRAFLDMTLGVSEATDRLHGQLLYATELFSPTTAQSFAINLTRLLRKLVGDPT